MAESKSRKNSKPHKTITLVVALIVVLVGSVLFAGALAGWFGDTKVTLDEEIYTSTPELIDISSSNYSELVDAKKSFVLFVDQSGCTTADRLRGYTNDYAKEKGINIYRIMFSDVKDSSLHDHVKYYPSLVLVNKGKVHTFLRADSDDDAKMYNDYDAFKSWLDRYL